MTANPGTWTGYPTPTYTYQWQDCTSTGCTNISGATSSSYTVQGGDVGSTIDVVVTGTNASGSASKTSAPTAPVTSDFSVSASAFSPATITRGGSSSSTISVTCQAGFTDAVSLSANGGPSGATYTFNPAASTTCGSSAPTLTVKTSPTGGSGTYTIKITATGGGKTHTASATLQVRKH